MDDTYPYPYPPKHRRPFPTAPPEPDSDEGNYLNSSSASSSSSSDEDPPPTRPNRLDSSPEILLKRRRVDQGFRFVPRTTTAPPVPAPAPAPAPAPSQVDWSKESTFALIEAWGDRFLSNGKRKLHSDQWAQVARLVNEVSGKRYSEQDCRNRLVVLKKRYEKEKGRPNSSGSSCSKWVYFAKMDNVMGTARSERWREREMPKLRFGVDNGEYVFGEGPGDTGSEGDEEGDDGGEDMNDDGMIGNGLLGYGVLADSVKRFGEVCEKMESNRKKQAKELESMRRECQMEMESRKREILERVQAELAKMEEGYDDGMDSEGMDEDDGSDGMDDDGDGGFGGNLSD